MTGYFERLGYRRQTGFQFRPLFLENPVNPISDVVISQDLYATYDLWLRAKQDALGEAKAWLTSQCEQLPATAEWYLEKGMPDAALGFIQQFRNAIKALAIVESELRTAA